MTITINPLVIDISHHNTGTDPRHPEVIDFHPTHAFGIRGVIHKASEGVYSVDRCYAVRRPAAREAGMLWGAYHFCSGDPVAAQVDAFMKAADPDERTCMVLDYEQNFGKHGNMDIHHAVDFMAQLDQKLGRKCRIYSGNWLKESIGRLGAGDRAFLLQHPLWLCHYTRPGRDPLMVPGYDRYWLWQYTGDGQGNPPHNVPGIIAGNGGLDINHYPGTADELKAEWV